MSAPVRERHPLARGLLVLAVAVGYLALLGAFVAAAPAGDRLRALLGALALGAVSLGHGPRGVDPAWNLVRPILVVGAQVFLLWLLGDVDGGSTVGLGLVLQGFVLRRLGDRGGARLAATTGLGHAAIGLGLVPGGPTLALFLLQVLVVATCFCVPVTVRGEAATAPDPLARARFGVRASLPLVLLAFVGVAFLSRFRPFGQLDDAAGPGGPVEAPDEDDGAWSESLGFGAADGTPSDEPVLWLTLHDGDGARVIDGRPLWLKALCLDTFQDGELRRLDVGAAPVRSDADDGERDGWIVLDAEPEGAVAELEIAQAPLALGERGSVLLRADPVHAIRADAVRFDPDGALATTAPRSEWFDYSIRCAAAGLERTTAIPIERVAGVDAAYLQLPPRSEALDELTREARRITTAALTPGEKVRALLDHFRTGFEYSLEGQGVAGLDGLIAFLGRRSGYCTSYASTMVLWLRALGVPARAVTGYMVTEWDAELSAYLVRARHAHAWVEVPFEGRGWLAFDPTPSSRDLRASAAVERERPDAIDWGSGVLSSVRDFALNGRPITPEEVAETLREAPAALARTARERPKSTALGVVAILAAVFLAYGRGRRTGSAAARRGEPPPPAGDRARLIRALERRGLARRPSWTLAELARRAVQVGHGGHELVLAVALLDRERFAGRELERDEAAVVDACVRGLESR